MKLLQPLLLVGAIFSFHAEACIRIHTIARYNFLFGDAMTAQIWDNNFFYDVQDQGKKGANSETHWTFQFGQGHYVELWNSGKSGRVALTNGWQATLKTINTDFDKSIILDSDNGRRSYETVYESCLNDGFGGCGNYPCGLCDGNNCNP